MFTLRNSFAVLTVALAIGTAAVGCRKEPTRWDRAAETAKSAAAATPDQPPPVKTEGGKLNKFFPAEADGISRVFTQEKDGYAEARLEKDKGALATVSISDTEGDAAAKRKFETATEKVAGAPLVTVGKNQSAVLVGRYQVKVSSPTLDPAARRALLEKFDLTGLGKL